MDITRFLDLDAVVAPEFTIKMNGKTHVMVEPTVATFAANLDDLAKMPMNATPAEELEMSIKMILQVFPSIERSELTALGISKVRQIGDFVMRASGQVVEQAGDAVGNAPKAS